MAQVGGVAQTKDNTLLLVNIEPTTYMLTQLAILLASISRENRHPLTNVACVVYGATGSRVNPQMYGAIKDRYAPEGVQFIEVGRGRNSVYTPLAYEFHHDDSDCERVPYYACNKANAFGFAKHIIAKYDYVMALEVDFMLTAEIPFHLLPQGKHSIPYHWDIKPYNVLGENGLHVVHLSNILHKPNLMKMAHGSIILNMCVDEQATKLFTLFSHYSNLLYLAGRTAKLFSEKRVYEKLHIAEMYAYSMAYAHLGVELEVLPEETHPEFFVNNIFYNTENAVLHTSWGIGEASKIDYHVRHPFHARRYITHSLNHATTHIYEEELFKNLDYIAEDGYMAEVPSYCPADHGYEFGAEDKSVVGELLLRYLDKFIHTNEKSELHVYADNKEEWDKFAQAAFPYASKLGAPSTIIVYYRDTKTTDSFNMAGFNYEHVRPKPPYVDESLIDYRVYLPPPQKLSVIKDITAFLERIGMYAYYFMEPQPLK